MKYKLHQTVMDDGSSIRLTFIFVVVQLQAPGGVVVVVIGNVTGNGKAPRPECAGTSAPVPALLGLEFGCQGSGFRDRGEGGGWERD